MKIGLIIPLYKQSKNWEKIVAGLRRQSVKPDCVYLMVDRPHEDNGLEGVKNGLDSDRWNAIEEIVKINSTITEFTVNMTVIDTVPNTIQLDSNHVFMAGYIRNLGISKALNDGCDVFIFIDGDCVPQADLIKSHVTACDTILPVLSVGRRRESKYRWLDQREMDSKLVHYRLFERNGTVINNPEMLKNCLIVWSCNIALNRSAIKLIYRFNSKYYNYEELFNSAFNGKWGGEDGFLGITAWYCKIFITTIGNLKSGVEHIDHPRPDTVYNANHKSFFDYQCDIIRKKTIITPITLELLDYSK